MLVDGFDAPPAVMMTYNPRYYAALLEACGFTKAKDLWAWELSSSAPPPEKVARIAEKIRQREGIIVRPVNLKDFDGEVPAGQGDLQRGLGEELGLRPDDRRRSSTTWRKRHEADGGAGAGAHRRGQGRAGGLLADAARRQPGPEGR